MMSQFPSVLQLLPELSGRPSTNLIPSQIDTDFLTAKEHKEHKEFDAIVLAAKEGRDEDGRLI